MYLTKIVLENFQAFERGEFDLSPNLNILVGVSNVGKSSVARALSLLLFNQWDKSWVRHGAKYCKITVQTNTGISVIREKGEKINRYILFFDGAAAQTYESFGTEVPEAVQQALKIHEVQVDSTDTLNLNLAGQMDSLFLLSQTGSYRAKVLGKLSGATYLDHAIRELNRDKRQVTAEKNTRELELQELQVQADKLGVIEAYSSQIVDLEQKLATVATQEARLERIRSLFERVKILKEAWLVEFKKQELLASVDLTSIPKLEQQVDKINALSSLWDRAVKLKAIFEKQNKLSELLNPVDLSVILTLSEKVSKFKIKKDLICRLVDKLSQIALTSSDLESAEKQHKETAQQYSDTLREAGVCPICNSNTKDLCVQ